MIDRFLLFLWKIHTGFTSQSFKFKRIGMKTEDHLSNLSIQGMAPLLLVFDMPSSIRFYCDLLGFEVVKSSGEGNDVEWVLLKLADTALILSAAYEKHERPAEPAPIRKAGHADVTLYFRCFSVEDAYTFLQHKGVRLKKPFLTKFGWRALDVIDPDGYGICLYCPDEL